MSDEAYNLSVNCQESHVSREMSRGCLEIKLCCRRSNSTILTVYNTSNRCTQGTPVCAMILNKIIRIYHECEGRIEKSALRIADWHHEACRVMTNGDHEGWIFLSYPHTHDRFFFLLTTVMFISSPEPKAPR